MMKKACVIVFALLLGGCSSGNDKAVEKSGTGTYTNSKGEVTTAKVKVEGDTITEVKIDETAKDKEKTKRELGNDYNMKQASGIGKEWYEQVDFLENYIVKHGVDSIELNDDGTADNDDVEAGCTITIDGFLKAVEDAKANAK